MRRREMQYSRNGEFRHWAVTRFRKRCRDERIMEMGRLIGDDAARCESGQDAGSSPLSPREVRRRLINALTILILHYGTGEKEKDPPLVNYCRRRLRELLRESHEGSGFYATIQASSSAEKASP